MTLKISALCNMAARCGITQAARENITLMRDLVDAVEVRSAPPLLHPIVYHHGMPSDRPQPWMTGKKVIGYWVCESSVASPDYKAAMDAHTQIWTASEASAKALRAIGSSTPVRVIPHVVTVPAEVPDRSGRDTVTTLFAFMPPMERKNPEALLRAWQAAFPREATTKWATSARLIVKMRGAPPSLARLLEVIADADPRIEIIDKDLTDEEMDALYERADIWCSMQRAGAFELHIASAAAHGLPVITTDVGGPRDYLSRGAAVFVGGNEIAPLQECPLNKAGVWIEPDAEQVIAALQQLARSPKLRARMGDAGRACIAERLNAVVVSTAMHEALDELVNLPVPEAAPVKSTPTMITPPHLRPLRTGLDVVGNETRICAPDVPVIISHRRSGTHLLGEVLVKHWGINAWLKSHDWPERRPIVNSPIYVLRNPIDALYATWRWWRTGGGAQNGEIARVMDGITFSAWLSGDAGRLLGYQAWADGVRDNMEVSRGQMYDPMLYWRDHWRAAHEAGLVIVLYEDLVTRPEMLTDVLTKLMGRAPTQPLAVLTDAVGIMPGDSHDAGKAMGQWPASKLARLHTLLSVPMMRGIQRANLEDWLKP